MAKGSGNTRNVGNDYESLEAGARIANKLGMAANRISFLHLRYHESEFSKYYEVDVGSNQIRIENYKTTQNWNRWRININGRYVLYDATKNFVNFKTKQEALQHVKNILNDGNYIHYWNTTAKSRNDEKSIIM